MNALLVCADDNEAEFLDEALRGSYFLRRCHGIEQANTILQSSSKGAFQLVLIQCSGIETPAVLIALGHLVQELEAVYVIRCREATEYAKRPNFPPGTRFFGSSVTHGRHYVSRRELPARIRLLRL